MTGSDREKPSNERCPLFYFFPLLQEWISLTRSDSSATRDLLRRCLLNILDTIAISQWTEQRKCLINLAWLIERENQGDDVGDETKISSVVALLLPRFVSLLPSQMEEKELRVSPSTYK